MVGEGAGLRTADETEKAKHPDLKTVCSQWSLGAEEQHCPQSLTSWGSKVTSQSLESWVSGLCGGWPLLWLHFLAKGQRCQECSPITTWAMILTGWPPSLTPSTHWDLVIPYSFPGGCSASPHC